MGAGGAGRETTAGEADGEGGRRAAPVETVELAPGLEVSRVITGLWQVADMEKDGARLDPEAAGAAMAPYVEAGLTTFDMADHYGSAEEIAGWFRHNHPRGAEARLLTKWVPPPGPVTRREVRAAVERALARMRDDRLDLLQLHAWAYDDPAWLDALFGLDALREEGLIRHLGLTNVDTAHLAMVLDSGVPVESNQVCFSLIDRRPVQGMTDLARERGVGLLAYGTLAGGLLTERWLGAGEPDIDALGSWSRMKYARFIGAAGGWEAFQRLLEGVAEVAGRRDASFAAVATRWVLDQPGVAAVIVGARLGESQHLDDTLRVLKLELDADDRRLLEGAAEELNVPGDCGDEYRRPPYLTAAGDLSDHLDALPPPYPVVEDGRGRRALSGTVWEDLAGFSRAVRRGDRILVSGTTATHRDRLIGGDSAASQTHFVIDKVEGAIRSLGGGLEDVVRTRVFVPPGTDWEPVARAHGRRFRGIQPANTLVRAGLVGEGYRVEMEAEAVVPTGGEDDPAP